jgi:hypothetical protein
MTFDRLSPSARHAGSIASDGPLNLVTDEANGSANVAILACYTRRHDGSSLSATDVSHVVDQARAEHDRASGTSTPSSSLATPRHWPMP